jgi:uncharacterized protein YjaG (DUF416 family)
MSKFVYFFAIFILEMAPFYAEMCKEFNQAQDKKLMDELKKKNLETIALKDKKIQEAEELEGKYTKKLAF